MENVPSHSSTTTALDVAIDAESETSFAALLDLLIDAWVSSYSALRNMRLLIACISKYLSSHEETDTRRVREGREMKRTLMELYKLWISKGKMNAFCSTEELLVFVRYSIAKDLYSLLVKGIMSEETYDEWLSEYKGYLEKVSGGNRAVSSDVEKRCAKDFESLLEDGFDSLFDAIKDAGIEPIPQHLTKLENGRLYSLKSPGEIGDQLIRLYVYDVKDVMGKEKRNWWRVARVRAQFLGSLSGKERKLRLLRQMLDEVASDMKRVSGVTKEVRNVFQE